LKATSEIPVWHDDQQGTATVVLSGLINALQVVGKKPEDVAVSLIGAGASNLACARLMFSYGIKPLNTFVVDSKGILHRERKDIEMRKSEYVDKWRICQTTNGEGRSGGISDALKNVDVCIALSTPGPDTIKKDWVVRMAKDSIVFACANPIPEIWPWDAKEAGAKVVATGRSDFPNQINNSLGFPGIFRGTLDVQARAITDEMCIAAADELAKCARERGINENNISPNMDEWKVYPREAVAVALKAQELGLARIKLTRSQLYDQATTIIKRAREMTQKSMELGYIRLPEES
jgi:malate dehydrogenase (oxaloacetate-decarboxylating)